MENWKEAHDKAKEYISALEEMKETLRDQCIELIKERDFWKACHEEQMKPPRWIA
jgi:hypothetical protein